MGRDREWYALDGKTPSIRSVARAVGRLQEYDVFYEPSSKAMHTSTYKNHVLFMGGAVRLKPMRNVEDAPLVINMTGNAALAAYRKVLLITRPGEMPAFERKYKEDWQQALLSMPTVKVDFAPRD